MPRSFNAASLKNLKKPRVFLRAIVGVLLAANLVAAAIVFKPWGGSVADLERQAASLRQQVRARQAAIDKLRGIVDKVEAARTGGDEFLNMYLMSRKTVSSALLFELDQTARKAGVRPREASYSFEPIEGSDNLSKDIITATYEGTYADLMHFLNLLDRSKRFLIIESLAATPQQSGLTLAITMRLNAFVRDSGPPDIIAVDSEPDKSEPAAAPPAATAPGAGVRPLPVAAPDRRIAPAAVQPAPAPAGAPVMTPGRGFAPAPEPPAAQPHAPRAGGTR